MKVALCAPLSTANNSRPFDLLERIRGRPGGTTAAEVVQNKLHSCGKAGLSGLMGGVISVGSSSFNQVASNRTLPFTGEMWM